MNLSRHFFCCSLCLAPVAGLYGQTYFYDEYGRLRSANYLSGDVLTQSYAQSGILEGSVAGTDSDGDGLPDAFEDQIIEDRSSDSITSFADVQPGDDYDNDEVSNFDEYLAATDPTDGAQQIPIIPEPGHATPLFMALTGLILLRKR